MSRRRDVEIMFGSDSFLDVVANIVGILIILIVIAGVRVGQMPVPSKSAAVAAAPALDPLDDDTAMVHAADPPPVAVAEWEPEPEPAPLPELPELAPPPELVARVEQLEAEVAALANGGETLAESLRSQYRRQSELNERLQAARDLLAQRQDALNASRQQTDKQHADLRLAQQTLARLLAQVKAAEEKTPPVEALQHHITPVSRVVSGKEKHYRLDKNRVAEVPIEVLIVKLKDQIERRKDWLTRTRSHQGQVGPFAGFSMSYLVRIDMLNGLDELRAGHGGYRVSVASWEIVPEPDLKGETEQVALAQGSLFYESLIGADADTTLTFWVYPDSFPLYRKLQAFAHEQGFPVAARPLPKGIPIAGSPGGSKSASQ
jgi:hypothetical protein